MNRFLVIGGWLMAVGWLSVAGTDAGAGVASRPGKAPRQKKAPGKASPGKTGTGQKQKGPNRFRRRTSPRSRPAVAVPTPTKRQPVKRVPAKAVKRVPARPVKRATVKPGKAARHWAQVVKASVEVAGPSGVREMTVPVFVNKIGMRFCRVRPGTFTMGSPDTERGRNDDEPAHHVKIRRAYYISTTEVTVGQWRRFIKQSGYAWDHWSKVVLASPTDAHPIVQVSWHDAGAFCEWLSKIDRAPCRLSTEAEWEYACRAGATTAFSFGDAPRPSLVAYDGREVTAFPVTAFPANRWGLYGMHGNVWEWCQDAYSRTGYAAAPTTSEAQPQRSGARVIRSGSWQDMADYCRSANRSGRWPEGRYEDLGFRVVRTGP